MSVVPSDPNINTQILYSLTLSSLLSLSLPLRSSTMEDTSPHKLKRPVTKFGWRASGAQRSGTPMCVHSMVKIPKGALFTGSKSDRKDVSITVPKAASSALEATVSKAASSPLEAAVSEAAVSKAASSALIYCDDGGVTSDIKTESSKVG